jgi:hypothetical protein
VSDYLTLTDEDDGTLFRVHVSNTDEERIARDHRFTLAGRDLKFPCFADPDRPEDYLHWLHCGLVRCLFSASVCSRAPSQPGG